MNTKTLHDYCMSKKGTEETYPFDSTTTVFKVMGKMFALLPTDTPADQAPPISLKCDPAFAQVLRQTYTAVQPGYHLNKQHWNTVTCDDSIPEDEIYEWIDHSYNLVVKSLTKKDQTTLAALEE